MGGESRLTPDRAAYDAAPAANFLGLPAANSGPDSRVWLLPVPYEATASYGQGTRRGPAAILDASGQVELYDRRLDSEPALQFGVHTLPPLAPDLSSPDAAVSRIAAAVEAIAAPDRLLCLLGGEHSISVGAAAGLRKSFGDFVTVQIDAHADLRDSYEGTAYSHACAARRIFEQGGDIIQIGVRSLDIAEAEFLRSNRARITCRFAEDIRSDRSYLDDLAALVRGRKAYLTIDVDGLDPSIMPATGTPEPGGLSWDDVTAAVETVAAAAHVVAFDCVELAPIAGQHVSQFTAAKLIYRTMTAVMNSAAWTRGAGR